ncbi:MAG: DNRLRE domain-containing protein [Candidatus Eisenbacteria bacterium]|nr:DNRLRE domain-containing protein [Candidatus Eisenbacteria bacterium]
MRRIDRISLGTALGICGFCAVASLAQADVVALRAAKDNTLYEANPTGSNGVGDYVFTGTNSQALVSRTVLAFDIAGNIPPGSTIHSVTLQLHASRVSNGTSETTSLHRLLADWGEAWSDAVGEEGGGAAATDGDATWLHRFFPNDFWTNAGGDFVASASASRNVSGTGTYTWSDAGMATDVQGWLDDPYANFGWIVRGDEGSGSTAKRFDSRSNPTASFRPELTVDYTPGGTTVGACCLADDFCLLLTSSDCSSQGGTYQGDDTTCTTDPCDGIPGSVVIEPARDNTLYEEGGVSNGGGEFFVSGMNGDLIKRRGLLEFDLEASLPAGAHITGATLTMYMDVSGNASSPVALHRVLADWGEGTADADGDEGFGAPAQQGDATWQHTAYPDEFWSSPGGDYVSTASASTNVPSFSGYYSWSGGGLVADLQAWVDDPSVNFGWMVVGRETFTATTQKRWVSREGADPSLRPKLDISYSAPPPPPPVEFPPVPVPPENPITEGKRVLGKILFWEEQLSSDGTVACGTCHRPGDGGVDPRVGVHPGFDLAFDTEDDVLGSPGVVRRDSMGVAIPDPIFGTSVQVTGRASMNFFGGLWAQRNFWDGRAESEFRDPVTDDVAIGVGGALESQAVGPIVSSVEMAHDARAWSEVTSGLRTAVPMVLASDLPSDVIDAIATSPTYPELFAAAFGDTAVTATRIAFAIATYERTLVADQTPWDAFEDGDTGALTPAQQAGADFVQNGPCAACHGGPLFTNDSFRNVGLRPADEDIGLEAVTGNPDHRGRFKVPSLRNVGLRGRLMHTGQIEDVADALRFYSMIGHTHFTEFQDENILGGIEMTEQERAEIEDFLVNGLTDPRVANETFPFDRPKLGSENVTDVGPDITTLGASFDLAARAMPNPFRDAVGIGFRLPTAASVEVSVFTASGQLIRRALVLGTAGDNLWTWDGRTAHGTPAANGVYFLRLRAGGAEATGRLLRVE